MKTDPLQDLQLEWHQVNQKLDKIRAGEYWFRGDPAEVEGALLLRLDEIEFEIAQLQND
ncbi:MULTISPECIES: hypothetical protein [Pirellulaceae]|uniref:hypothetical protein n=1 Tax=Pirellulaceae TaxID=2691357 RepID=UPI0013049B9A|nr:MULTISPECIES: hypothetical protein [Pirellulaceae]